MRLVWALSAIAVFGFAASASAQQVDQNTRQQIERLGAAYAQDENKGDAAGIAGLFTKDGVLVGPLGKKIVKSGRQEIEQSYVGAFKATKTRHFEINIEDLSALGANAIGIGTFHFTGQGQKGAVKLAGHWTAVYVPEGGAWKIRVLTFFPDPPPPK